MKVLHQLRETAMEQPDAPALVHNLEPLSYREFHLAISGMRRSLAARIAPGRGIAAMLIHDIKTGWIADLALRSLGLDTVALQNASDLAALDGMELKAVITAGAEGDHDLTLAGATRDIVVGPDDWADGAFDPVPDTASGGHILLTSATTGRPKLIMIDTQAEQADRHSPAQLYASIPGLLPVEDGRGVANLLGFGLWTAIGYSPPIRTWGRGGAIITHQGPDAARSLDVPGITHLVAIPAYLAWLLSGQAGAVRYNERLQLLVGGGALSAALFARAKEQLTPHVATLLGSSETGIWALTPIATDEDLRWHRIHPDRVLEVVDDDHRPLPPGQLGRIRLRQDNGVTGYLNDPVATAEFFFDDCFYPGDLGVLDGRGRLALSGRITDLLNWQGQKIPAAPLEEALQRALGLEGVCALSEVGPGAGEELHVVLETSAPLDQATLREAARAHIAGFTAVQFHFMPVLPRNHMGKIERLKLKRQLAGG